MTLCDTSVLIVLVITFKFAVTNDQNTKENIQTHFAEMNSRPLKAWMFLLAIAMSIILPFPIWDLYFSFDTSALTPVCIFCLIPIFVKLRAHGKIVQVSLEKFYGIILQTHLLPQENKFGHNIFTLKIFPKLLDGKANTRWLKMPFNWHKYCQAPDQIYMALI